MVTGKYDRNNSHIVPYIVKSIRVRMSDFAYEMAKNRGFLVDREFYSNNANSTIKKHVKFPLVVMVNEIEHELDSTEDVLHREVCEIAGLNPQAFQWSILDYDIDDEAVQHFKEQIGAI